MELGSASGVFQPRILGRVAESVSSAAHLVSSPARGVGQPAWLPRQLALSSATLSSAVSWESARLQPSSIRTWKPARLPASWKSAGKPRTPDDSAGARQANYAADTKTNSAADNATGSSSDAKANAEAWYAARCAAGDTETYSASTIETGGDQAQSAEIGTSAPATIKASFADDAGAAIWAAGLRIYGKGRTPSRTE